MDLIVVVGVVVLFVVVFCFVYLYILLLTILCFDLLQTKYLFPFPSIFLCTGSMSTNFTINQIKSLQINMNEWTNEFLTQRDRDNGISYLSITFVLFVYFVVVPMSLCVFLAKKALQITLEPNVYWLNWFAWCWMME